MTLKGQYFEKIEWEIINRPWTNTFQILFFSNPLKKFFLQISANNKEKTIRWNKFELSTMPDDCKGTVF